MPHLLKDLPKDWCIVPFGNVISDSAFGPRFSGNLYADDGNVATLRTTDMDDDGMICYETMPLAKLDTAKFRNHLLRKDDLVITRSGTCGIAGIFRGFEKPVLPGAFLIRVRLNELADVRFFRYFFNSKPGRGHLLSIAAGAVQQNINITNLEKLPVPLPPLPVQRRIVGVLSAYEDLIENNHRRIRILETMARALYREWFVHFQFPGNEKFPRVASPIGKIPKGWEVKCVSDCVHINPRVTIPREGEKPFVPMGCLSNDTMLITGIESRKGNSGAKFQNGDTLFARITPCLENGKTGFVQFLPDDKGVAFGSTEFIILRSNTLTPEYVYCLARSDEFRDVAIKSMSGATGRQRVQEQCFDDLQIAQPPHALLDQFSVIVAPSFRLIYKLQLQIQNLRQARDLLLPRLLSGRIQLPNEQQNSSNIISLPGITQTKKTQKATEEFVEAVVIAQLTRLLATSQYPLGRLRYNKLAYLAHRKSEDDVKTQYLKKAAGPYSPWAKYGGPEQIAIRNGYVKHAKSGQFEGFIPGEHIDKIDTYLSRYPVCASISWVVEKFRYRKKDDLELLATVDFAALDLLQTGLQVTKDAIKQVIATNQEWAPKLNRKIFSDDNISRALTELEALFPGTYSSDN